MVSNAPVLLIAFTLTAVGQALYKAGQAFPRATAEAVGRLLSGAATTSEVLDTLCLAAGRRVIATDVDHFERHRGPDDPKFWDLTKLVAFPRYSTGGESMTKFTVKVLLKSAVALSHVADTLDRLATRLDAHAFTREVVRDYERHLAYLEEMDWLREHTEEEEFV